MLFTPYNHYQNTLYQGLVRINSSGSAKILFVNNEGIPRRVYKNAKIGYVEPSDLAVINDEEIGQEQPVNLIENSQEEINPEDELNQYLNCDPEFKGDILKLLLKYRDVVALPGEPYGETHLIKLALKLKEGAKPIALAPYRIPHSKEAKLDAEIDKMLKEGTIAPTFSPWAFPVVIVAKPDDR